MLFYYGTKARNLKNGQIINVECPECNVSMVYSIFAKYAHLYLIPLFPLKKITYAECNNCKKTFESTHLSATIQQKIEKSHGKVSNPFWMFSGLIILTFIGIWGYYNEIQAEKNSEIFIENPKVGDVYGLSMSYGHYTTLKVDQVLKDSLIVFVNYMEIDQEDGIDKIDLDKYYVTKEKLSKEEIRKFFAEKKIYSVIRH